MKTHFVSSGKILRIFFIQLIFFISIQSQWISLNSGTTNNLRSVNFVNLITGFACGEFGTIVKTTNSGTNWLALNSGTSFNLRSVQFINSNTGLSCGYNANNSIIIRTTNGGVNWNSVFTGMNPLTSVTFFNSSVAVSVGNYGTTLFSTDGGMSWQTGQPTGYLVTFYTSFMINATTGYCAGVNTIFSPLFAKTTNGGSSWIYSAFMVNNNEATLMDIHFFNEQNGIAVSVLWNGTGGISRTTNGGANWTHQQFSPPFYGIDFAGASTGFIAGGAGSVYRSTDGGISWTQQTSPTGEFLRAVDFIDSVNGFIAGDNGTILKTTNGGILAVKPISNNVPDDYELYQNYPNPFNPGTRIKFDLPGTPLNPPFNQRGEERSGGVFVTLVVCDILGREVATLVNEKLSPGTYEGTFDGTNYPSGVYVYTLTAGEFKKSRKLILLK